MFRPFTHRLSTPLHVAALLLSLLCAGNLQAQTLYQMELVVFARDSADAEVEEGWKRDYGLAYPERLIGLAPAPAQADPALPATSFQLLPAAARRLNNEAQTLDRRSNLRVLFHGAWVQPVGGIESADPILISGGQRYGKHNELEGYVVLTAERYLHLRTDLWMTRFSTGNALDPNVPVLPMPVITVQPAVATPTTESTASEASNTGSVVATPTTASTLPGIDYIANQIYVIDQERRMRSGELHYIDHPRFGMLVLVTPYTAPPPPTPAEPPQPAPTAEAAPISTAPTNPPVAAQTATPTP